MNFYILLSAHSCFVITLCILGSGVSAGGDERPRLGPNNVPQVVQNLPDGHEGPASSWRQGTVRGIANDSITIEFTEPYKETRYDTDPTGLLKRTVLLVYPPLPPKEMKLKGPLAQGKYKEVTGVGAYRVTDIRPGDHIIVDYSRSLAGAWSCESICISRRPGGKIPEAPCDRTPKDNAYKWHEYCQAHQDFEERGTPIPARFLPGYRDKIAPMPRVVTTPRIPDAQP